MRRVGIVSAVSIGVLLLIFAVRIIQEYLSDPASYLIRSKVKAIAQTTAVEGEKIHQTELLARFYDDADYQPAWSSEKSLSPKIAALLSGLRRAGREGLNPEDYHLGKIESLVVQLQNSGSHPGIEKRVDLDLLLTDAFISYGSHLLNGRVDPRVVYPEWYNFPQRENGNGEILAALKTGNAERALKDLRPLDPGYERLREGLFDYKGIEDRGGWPLIPGGEKLKVGDWDSRVPLLRKRLAISGDLNGGDPGDANLFDKELDRAIRLFQARHGLLVDGVLGASTISELNVPVEKRVSQIRLNMERLRWLPRSLGGRYIFVNVASFSLEVVEKDQTVMAMRIIVGRDEEDQRTFIFTGTMTYLEINPYWNVPESIAVNEVIPRVKSNPWYLASQGIRILDGWSEQAREIRPESIDWISVDPENFPYRFRQDPGPKNPLGRIKFMFPNDFSVYLHDTPIRYLFERTRRTFSHGCIRIEKPLDLAVYLLKDNSDWTKQDILRTMASKQRQVITLPEPVPVYIYYLTAWADRDGRIQFRKDVYNGDGVLEQALKEKPERLARAR